MSWIITAIVGATVVTVVSDAIAANSAKDAAETQADAATEAAETSATAAGEAAGIQAEAAKEAARIQAASAAEAIAEQKRQFDSMRDIMKPWVDQGTQQMAGLDQYQAAGSDALKQQRAMMGLDGYEAQRNAISGIAGSAEMQGLVDQGENAMLQSGAATGGLRGGNIQGALAQYRPSVLSSLINNQYSKLGGMIDMGQGITMNRAALGQASAAGVGAAGMQSASSIGNILQQSGNAQAGGIMGAGNAAAGGIYNAGQANAQGILGAGNATAQGQLAQGQIWGNLGNQLIQNGLMGYGISKW